MILTYAFWTCCMLASKALKLSLLIGSSTSISLLHVVAPVGTSLFTGLHGLLALTGIMVAHYAFPIIPLKIGLPTLAATLAWSLAINQRSSVLYACARVVCTVALPLTCMALFIAHPTGNAAWAYSLYWLIPVGISVIASKHTLLLALQSTFIAHAVGSIIWLYTTDMTATMWLSLIPLVAIERFTIAGLMHLGHKMLIRTQIFIQNTKLSTALNKQTL